MITDQIRVPAGSEIISEEDFRFQTGFRNAFEKLLDAQNLSVSDFHFLAQKLADKPKYKWTEYDHGLAGMVRFYMSTPAPVEWLKWRDTYGLLVVCRIDRDFGWIVLEREGNVALPNEWACTFVEANFPTAKEAMNSLAAKLCEMASQAS